MKKTILICSNLFPPHVIGGAELIAYYHARELRDRGHRVVVFCGDLQSGRPRHSMIQERFEDMAIFRVALEPRDTLADYTNFFHIAVEQHFDSILATCQPDVVHLHNLIGLSAGLPGLCRQRGIRTFLTVHDHWGFCYKNTILKSGRDVCSDFSRCAECMPYIEDGANRHIPIRMRRDFLAMQFAELDLVISPSRYLASAYVRAGFHPNRVRVIWYGTDVDRFSGVTKTPAAESPRFTFCGYLGFHKGIDVLVEAARILRPFRPVINIVGSGEMAIQMRQWVTEERLESFVCLHDKVAHSEIESVLQETDVLVLPSVWPENQPLTILEAMASRTAVIASRIGGIPELVEHGRNGLLFDPGNAEDLAAKMRYVIEHPASAREFGDAGFLKIRDCTYAKQIARILDLYEEPRTAEQDSVPVIACAGERIPADEGGAISTISSPPELRFVMGEWLNARQLDRVQVLWVVDSGSPWRLIRAAQQRRIPLLVPERNRELTSICRQKQCGLYYSDAAEAEASIEYLLSEPELRAALGENGARSAAV